MQYYSKFKHLKSGENPTINVYENPKLLPPSKLLNFQDFLNKITLFTGESELGKTQITAKFLIYFSHKIESPKIYVLDIGPQRFMFRNKNIGGKITDFLPALYISDEINYYNCESIIPPRASGKSKGDILLSCEKNFASIQPKLTEILKKITKSLKEGNKTQLVFIINDLSIYLHKGSVNTVKDIIKLQKSSDNLTIFMNSYEGEFLINDYGSEISKKERIAVKSLKKLVDFSIKLKK
jgi:hypothetical protein